MVAAVCLGGPAAHAQAMAVQYWLPSWPIGFGGDPTANQSASTYGNFPGFDGSAARGNGFSYVRQNFSNGWFVGAQGGDIGLNAINRYDAFGNFRSLSSQGVQFGYNLPNTGGLPVTVYAGFNTLNYNVGSGGPFAAFDSTSNSAQGFTAQVGVEFKPTSNLSLSLGVGVTQQPDLNSLVLPGASPFTRR